MIEQEITLLTNGRISFQKCGNGLQFGYSKNRGVYSIKVKTSGEWNGLTIRAFWHIPDIKEPITSLLVDNVIRVPALVTSYKGEGRIVFEGSDGAKTVTSADVRYYVNKNSGTCDGTIPEPGTPAWQELVGTVKKYSDTAVEAKESAKKSADEAKQALEDTKDVKSQAIEEINSSKTAIIEEIENKKNLSIEEINSVKEDAKGELETLCDSTRDFANQAKEAADRAKASENASKKNADDSAATLQELKDGIASGDFKGDKGDPGPAGKDAPQIDDTTVNDSAPWSSKHIVDVLCPPISETGNPMVCYPVAGYPLGCKVSWELTQEGEGTPYPAGGGPNKLNVVGVVSNRTISGITFTVNADGTIGVNGTSTAICFLNPNTKFNKAYLQKIPAGTYRLDFAQTPLGIFLFGYYEDGSETPIVYAGNVVTYEQDAYVGPQIRVAAGTAVNTTVRLMLHTGTSTPSAYAGWENIRPIKGRDSVKVERCGENLLNPKENAHVTYTPYGLTIAYIGDNKVHLSGTFQEDGGSFVILDTQQKLLAGKGLKITGFTVEGTKQKYTLYGLRTKDETVIAMQAQFAKGDVIDMTVAVVVSGSYAPTAYAPYTGQTAILTLPSTIYGGEVDAVTGEGQETWKIATIDAKKIKFSSYGNDRFWNLPYHTADGATSASKIICSHFISSKFSVNEPYAFFFTQPNRLQNLFSSVDELNDYCAAQYAAGTPVQIVYQSLKEPEPFTATGAQPIPALPGVNTLLTDADSVTVTGRADPIKRITDLEDAVASMTNT